MHPGTTFADRFEIEREAGEGGMGIVYRAIDRTTGGPVAVKVLHGRSPEEAERFMREGRLLAELRGPRIVRYVAHGTSGEGEQWLAMEWLEGEDLAVRLRHAPVTAAQAIGLVRAVAEALTVAHGRGIVHRDIKPRNLYLEGGQPERVKVLDFGIARGAISMTRTGSLLGTPGYMSPEQARGDPVDARTDVFALGCVLFECLAGRPAFVADHPMALLAKVLLEEAPRLSEIRPDLPPALSDLTARMLAKDAALRPADAAAVAGEIDLLGPVAPAGEAEPVRASVISASITARELRLLCVVVVGGAGPADRAAVDALAATIPPAAAVAEALRRAARPFGARVEGLADGSCIATLERSGEGSGAATDQAARAARLALALGAVAPGAPVALATGRGDPTGHVPVGEAIDRAVSMLGAAAQGAIHIDDVTAGLLDERFEVQGGVLIGARESADAARTVLGRPTPCVGRDAEIALLQGAWAACVSEPVARAVVVTGAPGIGKSRVRHEIVRAIRASGGALVLVARGDAIHSGSPLRLASRCVRLAAGAQEGDPPSVQQGRIRARVAAGIAEPDRERVSEFLCELAGAPLPDGSVALRAARADPVLLGDQMQRAFEDWLGGECASQPVMLVLEDLQWGDLPSVRFIDAALRTLADRPLFVLALGRPEVRDLYPGLFEERGAAEIRLGEITRRAAERLATAVLGDRATPAVVAAVVERAAGNAFALEELLRATLEGKGDAPPGSVVAMVQARLERLAPEARRVLRAAAVFGRTFWRGGAAALLGAARAPTGFEDWLDELVRREIVSQRAQSRFPGEPELAFRHALVQEAAYATLTDADRALGHRLAADWLQKAGENDARLLAEHLERGGEKRRAVSFYVEAAKKALGGNDFAGVLLCADRAVALGAEAHERGHARLLRAEALRWRGDNAAAREAATEAMELLAEGSGAWCEAAGEVVMTSGMLADPETTGSIARTILGIASGAASRTEIDGPIVIVASRTANELLFAGKYDAAEEMLSILAAMPAALADADPAVNARVLVARATRALVAGDHSAHLALREAAAAAFERAGNLRSACVHRGNLGFALVELGAFEDAEMALRAAIVTAERMGLRQVVASARSNLGLALSRPETLGEARALEEEAIRTFAAQGDRRMEGAARAYLSAILASGGDLSGAEREARTAVERLVGVPPIRAFALATLAEALLASGRAAEAVGASSEAMGILEALGSIEEGEATVRLAHAEALFAAGDVVHATAAIVAARDRLLARAEKIADADLRRSFLGRVPENARTIRLAAERI